VSSQCMDLWNSFYRKFVQLWASDHKGDCFSPSFFLGSTQEFTKQFMRNIFLDTLGFTGAKIIRRIIGVSHVEDMECIPNLDARSDCEKKALRFAKEIIVKSSSFNSIGSPLNLPCQVFSSFHRHMRS